MARLLKDTNDYKSISFSIFVKIYFAGSIRGGRDDADLYLQIIRYLQKYGEVLTEHVGNKELTILGEDEKTDDYIYKRDMDWILQSNVIVAEVTTPSLGVGYEISTGVKNNKDILCLHRSRDGKSLSAMIAGCPDVTNKQYRNLDEAKQIIDEFFQQFY